MTKVSGANGVFTGEGFGRLPWTGETKIKVKFTSVGINTDKRLITGNIETVYDPKWGNMLSIDGLFEGGQNVGSVRSGLAAADFTVGFGITSASNISCNTATGTITITGANGQTQTLTNVKLPTTIQDNQGRIYGVSANGTVTLLGQQQPLSMTSAELNNLNADKGVATFLAAGSYAFDAYNPVYEGDILWRAKYEKIGDYGVARKAAAPGKPDVLKVNIRILDNTLRADNVKFMNSKGLSFTSRRLAEAGMYEFDIVGGPGGDAQEIYALHPKANETGKYWSLGKILVASYTPQTRKLVLVPVKGAACDKNLIATKLNDIYKPISVEWQVEQDGDFRDDSWDVQKNGLDTDGSGRFSTLTAEMKALNAAYMRTKKIDPTTIYLFVLQKAAEAGVAGDMPRGKQFGYLFVETLENMGLTAAHEVGHGVFNLKHPFDGYRFNDHDLPTNVMGYTAPATFAKYQWDQIHDKGFALTLFDKDEDSKLIRGFWYNPAGYPVLVSGGIGTLPPDADFRAGRKLNGILYEWKENGLTYKAKIENNLFKGYYKVDASGNFTTEVYRDQNVYKPNEELVVLLLKDNLNCTCDYIQTLYKIPANLPTPADYAVGKPVLLTEQALTALYSPSQTPEDYRNRPVSDCSRKSILYTQYLTGNLDRTGLAERIQGMFKANDINPLTGKGIAFNGTLLVTSHLTNPTDMAIAENATIAGDSVLFWMHVQADNKIIIKKIVFGADMDKKLEKGLSMFNEDYNFSQLSFLQQAALLTLNAEDLTFEAVYRSLDFISNLIGKAKIPDEVYDCAKTGYNKYYAKVFALATGDLPTILWNELKVAESNPDLTQLSNNIERANQMKFAFMCGMWNGLIGTIQSVPDLLKLVVAPLSSYGRNELVTSYKKFKDMEIKAENGTILCSKDQIFCKIWEIVKSIPSQFNLLNANTQCAAAHGIGEIIGPIAVMCLGDVAAGGSVVNTVFGNAARVIKWCDDVTDVFGYASKLTPHFVKKASGKLMVAVKQGSSDFLEQIDDVFANVKMEFTIGSVPGSSFSLKMAEIDKFYGEMKNAIDTRAASFEWDGKQVTVPGVLRNARKVLAKVSYNLRDIKEKFAGIWLGNVAEEQGAKKLYKTASKAEGDHIATLHDDRLEIHQLSSAPDPAVVDVSSLDELGNPIGLKKDSDGNCGVFVNGKWACFTGETLVHTEMGTMPIQKVLAGQKVWSYDFSKGQKVLSGVVKTMIGVAKQLVRVFVGKDTVQATTEHPFYANRQWTAAKDLRKGVNVLLLSGMIGVVDSVSVIDTLVTTYNFEIAETHNYFVGAKGVLVHNTCDLEFSKFSFLNDEKDKFLRHSSIFTSKPEGLVINNARFRGLFGRLSPAKQQRLIRELADNEFLLARTVANPDYIRAFDNYSFSRIYNLNGRPPVNSSQAFVTTRNGTDIHFDGNGFPIFTPHVYKTRDAAGKEIIHAHKIDMQGNWDSDYAAADALSGWTARTRPSGYVWHHHQDGVTMMLVPSELHTPGQGGKNHSGGQAVVSHNANNPNDVVYFPSPTF